MITDKPRKVEILFFHNVLLLPDLQVPSAELLRAEAQTVHAPARLCLASPPPHDEKQQVNPSRPKPNLPSKLTPKTLMSWKYV